MMKQAKLCTYKRLIRSSAGAALGAAMFLCFSTPLAHAQILDSFMETFDDFTLNSSVDSVDNWSVPVGNKDYAIVQNTTTVGGTGKALQISGDSTSLQVERDASYGGLTPIWVSYTIKPGVGGEERPAPSEGIAAISFDFSGKVLASDGTAWVDTGVIYDPDMWWEVIYKLNFSNHTWDLFLHSVGNSVVSFTPIKSGLNFIDPSINSLSKIGINGAYSASQPDDTYLDNLTVTYVERLEITTPAQTLITDQASTAYVVELQNSVGEPQRSVEDLFLELKTTSPSGSFSLQPDPWREISQILLLKDSTSATFFYRDGAEGKPTISVKEFPDYGWLEALQQQRVVNSMPHLEIAASSPQIAGQPFTLSIMAKDDEGNISDAYTGTVGLTVAYIDPDAGTKTLSPGEVSGFVGGVLTLEVTYPDAGTIVINALDFEDTDISGSSGEILFHPASLSVNVEPQQKVGRPFNIAVTGYNVDGAITPNYRSHIDLSAKAAKEEVAVGQLSPNEITVNQFDNGTGVASIVYEKWGAVNIWATDSAYPSLKANSLPVMFNPAEFKFDISLPPEPRDFYYIHEPIQIQMTPLSFTGATVSDYNGEIEFEAVSTLQLPNKLKAVDAGVPLHAMASSELPGTYTLGFKETTSGWQSETHSVQVKSATIKVLSSYAPAGGTAEVNIFLVDDKGDVIDAESTAILDFSFEESNPNNSINSSHYNYPIQLINGKATLLVSNTESETVTITPRLPYALQVESGTVKFGRYATKSVGVLLWREVDEEEHDRERR